MAEKYLVQVCIDVFIPVGADTAMKVQEAVNEFKNKLGVDIYGIFFKYMPPLGYDPKNISVKEIT